MKKHIAIILAAVLMIANLSVFASDDEAIEDMKKWIRTKL